jgi:hypothetical protein
VVKLQRTSKKWTVRSGETRTPPFFWLGRAVRGSLTSLALERARAQKVGEASLLKPQGVSPPHRLTCNCAHSHRAAGVYLK